MMMIVGWKRQYDNDWRERGEGRGGDVVPIRREGCICRITLLEINCSFSNPFSTPPRSYFLSHSHLILPPSASSIKLLKIQKFQKELFLCLFDP